jgi:aspartyl-tRNA(Asn)/glutamyl-tRNA(Gln) amidotransferase subunit C
MLGAPPEEGRPVVTREQVLHVARLAKLELDEADLERVAGQLGRILEYVEMLRELDEEKPGAGPVTGVAAVSEPHPEYERPLRIDEPRHSLARSSVLALAPRSDEETFLVPPVIEGGGDP